MSTPLENLLVKLGYPEIPPNVLSTLLPTDRVSGGNLLISPERTARVNQILVELTSIDELLASARENSMAKDLGTMKLDFSYHIMSLKADASGLLAELGQVVGLPVFYDRYLNEYPATQQLYAVFGITRPVVGAVYSPW